MAIQVAVYVNRATAILAGRSEFGTLPVDVDLSGLSEEDRISLAELANGLIGASNIDRGIAKYDAIDLTPSRSGRPFDPYPSFAVADIEAVRSILAAHRAAKEAKITEAAKKEADKASKWLAAQQKWLETPDDQLIRQTGRYASLVVQTPESFADHSIRDCYPPMNLLPEVKERLSRLNGVAKRLNEQSKADQREREAKEEAEKMANILRRQQQIEEIIRTVCSAEQQRRAAVKLLSEEEIITTLRNSVFAPLDAFPHYQQIKVREVVEATGIEEDITFSSDDAESATAEQFATLEAIQKIAKEAIPHQVKITLRWHGGAPRSTKGWDVERYSVHVSVVVGEIELSREYACP